MTLNDYQQEAQRTALEDTAKVADRVRDIGAARKIRDILRDAVSEGRQAGVLKKTLFYGAEYDPSKLTVSSDLFPPFFGRIERALTQQPDMVRFLHGVLGVLSEVGELIELYAAQFSTEQQPLEWEPSFTDETGDILWYLSEIATAIHVPLSDVAQKNIEKLKVRYPAKFTETAAIERDLNAEKGVFE